MRPFPTVAGFVVLMAVAGCTGGSAHHDAGPASSPAAAQPSGTGLSSESSAPPSQSTSVSPSPASSAPSTAAVDAPSRTKFGQSATSVAKGVPGCASILAEDASGAAVTGFAKCTLMDTTVLFVTTANAAQQATVTALYGAEGQDEGFFAQGVGYDAAADITKGDLAKQEAVAKAIVAALGGSVHHFTGGASR